MDYKPLATHFHMATQQRAEQAYRTRFNSESSLHWNFTVGDDSLFCQLIPAMTGLVEEIYQREVRIGLLWGELPQRARAGLLRELTVEEVVASNGIEGVFSTRQEIQQALSSPVKTRFQEFARLYADLARSETSPPTQLREIRAIYDAVLAGEDVAPQDRPDGELFRAGSVKIWDSARQRTAHHGINGEDKINAALLEFMQVSREDQLVSALVGHAIFEITHPFYDGNGRTGRFLMGVHVSRLLSPVTALTLARGLHAQKGKYYRAFTDLENPLNRAEATHFVIALLEILAEEQERLLQDLQARRFLSDAFSASLEDPATLQETGVNHKPAYRELIRLLGEALLFDGQPHRTLTDIAEETTRSSSQTRRDLAKLESIGLVEVKGRRPLTFTLSSRAMSAFGLESH